MKTSWKNSWKTFVWELIEDTAEKPKPAPTLPEVVEQARREWLDAQHYYNTVSDKDLVDHAVYMMQAAEKKYMYLLKQARQQGVTFSPYEASEPPSAVQ